MDVSGHCLDLWGHSKFIRKRASLGWRYFVWVLLLARVGGQRNRCCLRRLLICVCTFFCIHCCTSGFIPYYSVLLYYAYNFEILYVWCLWVYFYWLRNSRDILSCSCELQGLVDPRARVRRPCFRRHEHVDRAFRSTSIIVRKPCFGSSDALTYFVRARSKARLRII